MASICARTVPWPASTARPDFAVAAEARDRASRGASGQSSAFPAQPQNPRQREDQDGEQASGSAHQQLFFLRIFVALVARYATSRAGVHECPLLHDGDFPVADAGVLLTG